MNFEQRKIKVVFTEDNLLWVREQITEQGITFSAYINEMLITEQLRLAQADLLKQSQPADTERKDKQVRFHMSKTNRSYMESHCEVHDISFGQGINDTIQAAITAQENKGESLKTKE